MGEDFTHLHNHSHYSILDGAMSIDRLLERAKEDGQDAIALTDHGNMFGAIEFYKKARSAGIKPVVGCEVYVAPGNRFEKIDVRSLGVGENSYHLVLLAKDEQGYRNLTKLSSIGYLEGFYYKPRVDTEMLQQYSSGLIALSACLAGEIPNKILREESEAALAKAGQLAEIFGKENFFLELQDHGLEAQRRVNQTMVEFSRRLGIPLVATNDAHYASQEDSYAHDVLLCIQTGAQLNQEKRMRFDGNQFYVKTRQEMAALFSELPEAIRNTRRITEMVDLKLNLGTPVLPDYVVPDGFTLDSYLEHLAREGLQTRYRQIDPSILQRLEYELDVIRKMNFAGYFLIVQDFIRYAKSQDIPVGPGRGSAAGSLVSYCIGITDLDPLKYNLLFERFLNPDRVEMPDVDIDFCQERRDEVIRYVQEKYGKERVGQVIAFGSIKSKNALKDVGRVMGYSFGETNRLAKYVPGDPIPVDLKKALEQSQELRDYRDQSEESQLHIETSLRLEGLVRQASKHAAGVVISKGPLTDYAPLYKDKDGNITTQYDKIYLEAVGLVKMDFLGLKNLTVIKKAQELIREHRSVVVDFDSPVLKEMDDPKTYDLLASGRTNGVFQLENQGMQELVRKASLRHFEDIIAVLALYRPGPLNSGMVDAYLNRKMGKESVVYDHPVLEPILKDTYGVIVYQEQVMFISQVVGGFSMAEADMLRKVMAKKQPEKMPAQKEKFLNGARHKGFEETTAEKIFDQCATFAEYGFNKSHSAAYAVITYRTAYLKAHFPEEYMAALISADMDNTDKVVKYINEAKDMDICIQPPDVRFSSRDFTVRDRAINFGLSAIKNVGSALVNAIVEARAAQVGFTSIFDFLRRVPAEALNSRSLESLIEAGAFDGMGYSRRAIFEIAEKLMREAQVYQRDASIGQSSLFGEMQMNLELDAELEQTLRNGQEWETQEKLNREKVVLGFYISGHPLDRYAEEIRKFAPITTSQLGSVDDGSTILLVGVVSDLKTSISKKNGKRNAFFNLSDREGRLPVVVFNTFWEGGKERSGRAFPGVRDKVKNDAILAIRGTLQKEEDEIPKLFLKEAYSLEEARYQALVALHLHLPQQSDLSLDVSMERIRQLLVQYKGECLVFLHIPNGRGRRILQLPEKYHIKPQKELILELSQFLNEEAIFYSYQI